MRSSNPIFRVTMLVALLALALTTLFSAGPAAAKGNKNRNNNQDNGGPNVECPAGTVLIAKFNFEGGSYKFEKPAGNEGVVTITNGSSTGGSWSSTTPISAVIVKGGSGPVATKTDTYNPPATSGSFNNSGLVNNGGRTPAVSNVQFCGPDTPPPPPPACYNIASVELFDTGSQIKAVVSVKTSSNGPAANVSVTAEWMTPDGPVAATTVSTGADGTASFVIPQGSDGTYTVYVTSVSDGQGGKLCDAGAKGSISIKLGCCLESAIALSDMGGELKAEVAVQYTDGYKPDNLDVMVTWTLPDGTKVSQQVNTQADGTKDNIATFTLPKAGPGTYTIEVTGTNDYDGVPLCRKASATYTVK